MSAADLLRELRRLDVDVWLDGNQMRCCGPPGVLTPERREALTARRSEIEALLRVAQSVATPDAIVPIQPAGSRPAFFAVPGHNGDVFCFVRLARCLGDDQPFYGLQPPGLESEAAPLESIEELAGYFVEALIERQPAGPYQIGGYCVGGLTAFEMARQLRSKGFEVGLVALFGTSAPTALRPLNRRLAASRVFCEQRVRGVRSFASRSWTERLAHVRERAAGFSRWARPSEDPVDTPRKRVEELTVAAAYRYRPRQYDGRLTLLVPSEATLRSSDRPLDWKSYATSVDVRIGPANCDGDTMLKDPSAATFARHLGGCLADSVAGVRP